MEYVYFRCEKCGKELDRFCWECQEEMISQAFAEAAAKRKTSKEYITVPKEEYDRLLELSQEMAEKVIVGDLSG
jgi:hypothetical protein